MEIIIIAVSLVTISSTLIFALGKFLKRNMELYVFKSLIEHNNQCFENRKSENKEILKKLDLLEGKMAELKEELHIFKEQIKIKLNI